MTDTTAPLKPKYQLLLGLLPSLNTSLVAIVSALVTLAGTLTTQHFTAKPVTVQPKPVTVERVIVEKSVPVDLGPLTAKVDEALKEFRAAQSAAGEKKGKRGLK